MKWPLGPFALLRGILSGSFGTGIESMNAAGSTHILRRATAADIPALFRVRTSVMENHLDLTQLTERGVTHESLAATVASDDDCVWVIEEGEAVMAFSMADGKHGGVFAVFVHPDAEGRGYGRTLLRSAEEFLFGRGWDTIWLHTDADPSTRAHLFYRAAGWEMAGPADHGDVRYEKRGRS